MIDVCEGKSERARESARVGALEKKATWRIGHVPLNGEHSGTIWEFGEQVGKPFEELFGKLFGRFAPQRTFVTTSPGRVAAVRFSTFMVWPYLARR